MIAKKIIACFCCKIIFFTAFSQNLINNPSFEQIWVCPHSFVVDVIKKPFPEWLNPNNCTPDVFHICSDLDASVPNNFTGHLLAADGNAYAGIVLWEQFFKNNKTYDILSREYLQTKLSAPLKRNKLYCVKFLYANAQRTLFSCNGLGVAITKKPVNAFLGNLILQRPQVLNNPNNMMENTDWVEFCATYRADGEENYFTIGNFFNNEQTAYKYNDRPNLDSNLIYAYYLIDDVKMYEIDYSSECGCLNDLALSYDPFDSSFNKDLGYNLYNNESLIADNSDNSNNTGNPNNSNNTGNTDNSNNSGNSNNSNNTGNSNNTDNSNNSGNTDNYNNSNNSGINNNNNSIADNNSNNNHDGNSSDANINVLFLKKSEIDEEKLSNSNIGDKFLLNRIFFEFNSYELLAVSNFELDKLYDILESNKNIKIDICGHTDNIGSERYNKKLSLQRAETVYKYLLDKGILANRMKFKGFGTTSPVADNTTEEGREKNRRVEIIITEK